MPFDSKPRNLWLNLWLTLAWTILLAYFFANVEIQIEGGAGWAASLPTPQPLADTRLDRPARLFFREC